MKALLGEQDTSCFPESTGDTSVGNGTAIIAVGTGAFGDWGVRALAGSGVWAFALVGGVMGLLLGHPPKATENHLENVRSQSRLLHQGLQLLRCSGSAIAARW